MDEQAVANNVKQQNKRPTLTDAVAQDAAMTLALERLRAQAVYSVRKLPSGGKGRPARYFWAAWASGSAPAHDEPTHEDVADSEVEALAAARAALPGDARRGDERQAKLLLLRREKQKKAERTGAATTTGGPAKHLSPVGHSEFLRLMLKDDSQALAELEAAVKRSEVGSSEPL